MANKKRRDLHEDFYSSFSVKFIKEKFRRKLIKKFNFDVKKNCSATWREAFTDKSNLNWTIPRFNGIIVEMEVWKLLVFCDERKMLFEVLLHWKLSSVCTKWDSRSIEKWIQSKFKTNWSVSLYPHSGKSLVRFSSDSFKRHWLIELHQTELSWLKWSGWNLFSDYVEKVSQVLIGIRLNIEAECRNFTRLNNLLYLSRFV